MFYQKAAVWGALVLKSFSKCFVETQGLYAPLRIHPSGSGCLGQNFGTARAT